MRLIYTFIYYLIMPFVLIRLLWRSRHTSEYRKRWSERFGYAPCTIYKKNIWIHAVSVGETIAASGRVSLCYRRPRRPGWHYNLFCMIHGRCRDQVLQQIAQLRQSLGLSVFPFQILFSRQQFKQCGGDYFEPDAKGAANGN